MLQKRFTKKTECSKHFCTILPFCIEKDILSELNKCIFQISLKYINWLNELFQKYSLYWYYAVLTFTSKLCDPSLPNKNAPLSNNIPPFTQIKICDCPLSPGKDFSEIFNPPSSPMLEGAMKGGGGGECPVKLKHTSYCGICFIFISCLKVWEMRILS